MRSNELYWSGLIICINTSEIEDIADTDGIRRIIATSAFGRTRHSRLAYKSTTGHVGATVGRRLGLSG